MPMQISKLSLTSFRGASQKLELEIDVSKPLVMIFGENGTGKSTLIDAIEFIAHQTLGSLAERSSTNTSHAHTIGSKATDVAICLTAGSQKWDGRIIKSKLEVTGPSPKPKVHILRRKQLLALMESEPAKRYEQAKGFIDVQEIETCETQLSKAMDSTNADVTRRTGEQTSAEQALNDLWVSEGKHGTDALSWGEAKSQEDVSQLKTACSDAKTACEAIRTLSGSLTNFNDSIKKHELALADEQTVEGEIQQHSESTGTGQVGLVDLLGKVDTYLKNTDALDACPVCDKSIQKDDLQKTVASKLQSLQAASGLLAKHKSCKDATARTKGSLDTDLKKLLTNLKKSVESAKGKAFAPLKLLDSALEDASVILAQPEVEAKSHAQLVAVAEKLSAKLSELDALYITLAKDLNQFNAIKQHYDRIHTAKKEAKTTKTLLDQLDKVHTIVQTKRKEFTEKILDDVSTEADRIYGLIHPGESTGLTKLRIKNRTSLHHDANFCGHLDIPPQAYFSDSHLDTLGLALWLAIAKREKPEETILILEDILTSVDSPHMSRIADMLNGEASAFGQLIVTTHARVWRDRFRFGQGPGNQAQLIELQKWSLNRGVMPVKTKLAVQQLKDALNAVPFDRQSISSQAGILLEAMLDTFALLYRCSVPRIRDSEYTLSDLTSGCTKVFKKLKLEQDGVPVTNTPETTFNAIKGMAIIRNQVGCHFNPSGADYSDEDVRQFAEETHKLAELITCKACGDLARSNKGAHFACTCGKMKMTPLQVS